jgi:hypothetical protein
VDCEFLIRPNDEGKDMSAYQHVAAETDADFLVCFGESITIRHSGWLATVINARMQYGPGMYGFFASHMVRAHLNTTAFSMDTALMRKLPMVTTNGMRYDAEHGPGCWWQRLYKTNLATMLVTASGAYGPGHWREVPNGMHNGNQSECLVFSHHCDEFEVANPSTRSLWETQSNWPFKL